MTDNTTTPASDTELSPQVTATGSASQRNTNEILPEHQHHADAILNMDPLEVPRTHTIKEGWGASPLTLQASALPPAMAKEVQAKLNALGQLPPEVRAAKEAEFTQAAVRAKRAELVVQIGVGKDATPYHRELAEIAVEVQDWNRKLTLLDDELARVARYEMETDPTTGEQKPVPVYAVTGARAQAYLNEQRFIEGRIRQLVNADGTLNFEGARRAKEALAASVAARVELERQVSEEAEAKRLAETMGREERIKARAESIVRLNRNAT